MEDTKRGFEYGPRRTEQSTESSRKNAVKLLATTFWQALARRLPTLSDVKESKLSKHTIVEESLKHHETQQRRLDELQAVIESLEAERDALILEVREWRQCLDLPSNAQEAAEQPNTQLRLEENAVQSTNDYLGGLETLTAEELAVLQSEIIGIPVAIPSSRERYTMQVEDWQQSLVPSQATISTPRTLSLDVGFSSLDMASSPEPGYTPAHSVPDSTLHSRPRSMSRRPVSMYHYNSVPVERTASPSVWDPMIQAFSNTTFWPSSIYIR
ncbi:hypothetical protein D6D05_04237 [Aureobasidium pullulans]|nr:hypothetical protein D6D05_04237 [Aureobasidium pullulans]